MEDNGRETAPLGVWIGLTFIAVVSFWSQATVTEERFVPALNVIATKFNIPMDVAGATLMAAGASSPELFSSFVSLFITHSALGLGTIVGSEIFNQVRCSYTLDSNFGPFPLFLKDALK
jgi:Ca2+/Na+ antiporter